VRGEEELIDIIMEIVGRDKEELLGVGRDDASARKLDEGVYVFNVDSLAESSDLLPGMSLRDFGRKAVIFNYSDLAAKGAKPIFFMASLTLQGWRSTKDFEEIVRGIEEGATEYDTHLVGGDLGSGDELNLAGFAVGKVINRLVSRSGSRPGDLIYVTGKFGLTWLAFKHLLEGMELPKRLVSRALRSVYRPVARVREGILISRYATSCIDSSDGLYKSLKELSRSSGNGFLIDRLPIDEEVLKFVEKKGIDPIEPTFYGGEEFHLVFTVSEEVASRMEAYLRSEGLSPIAIGRVVEESGVLYRGEEVPAGGWNHFSRSNS